MLSGRGLWRTVESPADFFEFPGAGQSAQVIARDAEPIEVFSAYD